MPDAFLTEVGVFRTGNASKYLQQLCKHFGHKVKVTYDTERGEVALPPGPARMTASDTELQVEITAPHAEGIKTARHTIDTHLERFAFREGFKGISWRVP